ncbi:uncharacterized protein LOC119660090 isoform X4 [Hermetia illucens]|uniref:uncharacterized protein LOC119660090 isoform X4 n=1 Tax=Hermetia illucens TaxID=343691 RepID=UPI0018CBFE40|nr:uncharacterized protein LOC119660090 isoform X4 [Hermetia illucens]
MRDTVKFDPSIPDRQVTGESSTSQHTCSSASQTEYLDVQSLSSASSYMALPSLKHGKKHIPLSALGPPGPSSRRTGCSHSHCRCEEESIMQNMCNKRNERLSKPCKDGFCYCFTSDSEDFRKDPGTSAGHHRCKALRKEYAYHLPTESDCSEIVSSDQYFADKQKEKKKKRVSLPPEILESGTINRQNGSAGCGHKDGKCSNDNCRRRPFLATNKFQEFHCSDSDAPLIHIVQEVQRNVVVSEIRINRSKLKKSKVRSKSAGRSGDGSRNAETSTSEKIINVENLIDGNGGQVPEKLSNKTEGKDASTNTTALKNKEMQSRATNVPSQSEDDGIRTDLIKARPRSNKLKGGRLLMKRVGPDVSYRPIIGPPRKPPRNFSSSPDCSSSDISAMSIGDQPTMPASFRLPQETDDSFNGKDNSKKVSDDSLNSVMNQKPKVTKVTFDKLSGKVDSNGAGTSPPTSEGGYSRPAVASSNIAEESFETGPSSRQEFMPTCPPYSEIVSPDTTDINELLRMLPSVPTGPVIVNDSLNKLNIESATHPKNIEFAEVNVVPAGEIPNPEQVGWVPPAVYNMLSNETANQKFVSQHPVAEPQQVGWQPPPRLQIDTVDSGQKTSENENSHNFAENMELKSTPVKPDIPRNEMTPKNILREKVKNLPQPPSKPQRQNQTPKMATVREVSPSGEEELTVISSEPKDSALYPKLSSPIPVESNPIVNPISVKPKESISAAESVTVATTVKDSVTEKESTTAKEPASTPAGKSFQKRALKHTKSFLESLGFSKKKDGKDDRKSSNKEAKEPPKMVETVATQTNDTLVLQSRRLNFDYASDDTLNRRSITPIAGEDVSEVAKPTHHSDDGFDFSRKVQSPRPERSSQRKPFSPRNFLKNLQTGNEKVGHDESYKSYASDLSEDFTVAVQDLLGKARAKLEGETTAAETVTNTLTDESVAACTIAARADVHPEPVYAEIREVDDDGRARLDVASKETSHQGPDKDKIVYAKVVKKGGKQTPLSPHRPAPLPPGDLSDKEQGQRSGHSSDGQDKPGSSGTFKQTSQPRDSQSNIQERSAPSDGGHAESSQSSLPTQLPRGSQPTQIVKPANRPKQSPPPVPVDMSKAPAPQIVRLPTPPHHSPSHSRRSSSSTSSSRGLFSPHLDEFFSHGPLEEVAPTLFGRQRSSPGPIDSDSSGGGNLKRVPPSGLPQQSGNRAPPINRHGTDENYHDDNFKQQKPAKRGITSEVEYANIPSERFHQSDRPSGTTPQVGHPTHSTQQGHIRTRRSAQEPYSTDLIQAERNHPYGPQSAIHINPSDPQHFQSQNLRITPRSSPQGQSSPDQDDFREVYGSVNPEEYSGVGSQSFYSIQSDQYGTPMGWHQAQPIPGQPTRHNRPQQPTVHFAPGTGNQAQPMPFPHRSDHAENQGHMAGPHGWHQMQQPSTTNAPHNLQAVGSTANQNEAIRVQPQGWHQTQPTLPQTRDVHQPQPSSIATRHIHQEQIQRDILPEDNEVQRTAPVVYPNIVRTQPVMPSVEEEFRDLPEYSPATVQSTHQSEDVAPCVPARRRRSVEDPKVNSGPNQSEVHIVERAQVSRKSDYQDQQQSEDSLHNKKRNIRSTNDHPITSERQNVPMTPHSSIRPQEVDYVAMLPSPPQNISMGNPPVVEYGWPASGATVTYPASSATNIPSTSFITTAGVSQPTFSATDATPSTSYTTVADAIPSTSFATATLQANSEQFIETERPLTSSTPQPPATVEPIPSTSFNNSHEKDSPPRARVLSKSDLSQTSDIFLENLHHKNVNVTQYSDRSDDEKRSNLDSPRAVAQFFYYDSSTGNGESSNSSFCRDPLGSRRQTSDGEYEDPCCGEESWYNAGNKGIYPVWLWIAELPASKTSWI